MSTYSTYEGHFTEEMEYEFDNATIVKYDFPTHEYDVPTRLEKDYNGHTYILYSSSHREILSDGRKIIVTAYCRIGKDKNGNWIREPFLGRTLIGK